MSCSVDNQSPGSGGSVTYTATPSGGAGSPYTWTASDGASGLGTASTATRSFPADGIYGMTVAATGAASAANCPNVTVGCGASPALAIQATPNRIHPGSTSLITWSASGVPNGTSCSISGPGISQNSSPTSCSIPNGQATTPALSHQAVYGIVCGTVSATAVVNILPNFNEF